MMSNMPGRSYKTRGSAPRYHQEMPYGGTPGVYAIRLDELGGPKQDMWDLVDPLEWLRTRRGRRR